jgi:peptide/nickel transport system permease protein
MNRAGAGLLLIAALAALLAPAIAPHRADEQFTTLMNAPPTLLRLRADAGPAWQRPFIYAWSRVSQLEQRYAEDRSVAVPLRWFDDGHLMRSSDDARAPLLLLGADSFGRDVFSRLLYGARTSMALSLTAAIAAVCLGGLIGGVAGFAGGRLDEALMRVSEFVIVLPAIYVVLALRAVLPLVLSPSAVFMLLATIFAVVGAPFISRGVRAIVRGERSLDYIVAATSLGASRPRLLCRHLLPAARGFIVTQATILLPSFIVAEATLSYVGLGFPEPVASWGTMLQDAANIRTFSDFPWLLSPAVAIFLVVLGLNLLLHEGNQNSKFSIQNSSTASPRRGPRL